MDETKTMALHNGRSELQRAQAFQNIADKPLDTGWEFERGGMLLGYDYDPPGIAQVWIREVLDAETFIQWLLDEEYPVIATCRLGVLVADGGQLNAKQRRGIEDALEKRLITAAYDSHTDQYGFPKDPGLDRTYEQQSEQGDQ